MVSDDTAETTTAEGTDSDWEPESPTRLDDDTIVVPMRMYKGITVFSTLVATALVVFGFFLFDAATQQQNLIRQVIVWIFETIGYVPPSGVFDVAFGLAGVASILLGAGSYILGSRFKTADMVAGGKEDDPDADQTADGEDDSTAEDDGDGADVDSETPRE